LPVFACLACGTPDPHVTTLGIATHELGPDCAVSDAGGSADYSLSLTALGPFAAAGSDLASNVPLAAEGWELGFDARTVGVDAIATRGSGEGAMAPVFTGHSERRRPTGLDVLLWPSGRACSLATGPYPGTNGGQALGYSPRSGLALVAGEDVRDASNEQGTGPGSALVFDADRGDASIVPREGALQVPRAFATVTELGEDLLVAGGENPLGASTLDAAGSAELYSTKDRAFTTHAGSSAEPAGVIELIVRRSRHAAVTLPATGETLLIGGYEPEPETPDKRPSAITLLEAVSPSLGKSISGFVQLGVGRIDPTALVLSDGRLFVGGGSSPGENQANPAGLPLGLVEVFTPDAGALIYTTTLPARPRRTFATLPGGGVLSVASCEVDDRVDCACFTPHGTACALDDPNAPDDPNAGYVDGYWLEPEGALEPVAFAAEDATASCATPLEPLLVPGSDGAPWLITKGSAGTPTCLWRFEPWPGEGSPGDSSDARRRPRFVPTAVTLAVPLEPGTRPLSLGPDAFVWIGENGGFAGAALGHRGPLTRDSELLTAAPGSLRPTHLAPDHDPNPAPGEIRKARATFDTNFALELEPPEPPSPPLTVWIADTTYDDAIVSVSVSPQHGVSDLATLLPALVFGTSVLGDPACPWPAPGAASISAGQLGLSATRRGNTVTLAVTGVSATTRCGVSPGPLAVGVRAGVATTKLVSFVIERD
jgi:hypothetical protein